MTNLSPKHYSTIAQQILDDEDFALSFINMSAFNNQNIRREHCNEKCRKELYCQLNYAVNEQSVLCVGYDFSLWQASRYFLGAFQNPWYQQFAVDD